jgi:[ribosomal protein S5]-alanine N-acetyltransferase
MHKSMIKKVFFLVPLLLCTTLCFSASEKIPFLGANQNQSEPKQFGIETERLLLRKFTTDDKEALFKIFNDGGKIHKTDKHGPLNDNYVREYIRKIIEHYEKYGFGVWIIVEHSTNNIIGYCGIKKITINNNDNEKKNGLSYRIHKDFWNKGFATEAVRAVLDYAFNALKLSEVVACILNDNVASKSVAKKVGLKYLNDCIYNDEAYCLYTVNCCIQNHM